MCAWQQERLHPGHNPTTVRFPWLWQKLLHYELLKEEASLAGVQIKSRVICDFS